VRLFVETQVSWNRPKKCKRTDTMSKNITIFHQAFESGGGAGKELVKQVLKSELIKLKEQLNQDGVPLLKGQDEDKRLGDFIMSRDEDTKEPKRPIIKTDSKPKFFKLVASLIDHQLKDHKLDPKDLRLLKTISSTVYRDTYENIAEDSTFRQMCMLQDWSSLDKKPKQSLVKAFLQQVVEKYKQPDIIALGEYEYKEQLDGYKMTPTKNASAVRAMSVFVRNDRNSELKAKLLHIGNLEECIAVDNILFLHSPNDNGIPGKVLDAISGIKPDLAKLAGDLAKLAGDLEQYKVFIGDFNFPSNTNSKNLVIRKASQASSLSDPGAEKINKKIQAFKKKIQAFKKSANVGVVTRSDLTTEKIIPDGDTSGAYPVINHTDNKYYLMGNHRGFCVELVRTVKRPREEDPDDNSGVSATPTKKSKKDK
jgi:hypothetical protein